MDKALVVERKGVCVAVTSGVGFEGTEPRVNAVFYDVDCVASCWIDMRRGVGHVEGGTGCTVNGGSHRAKGEAWEMGDRRAKTI